MPSSGELVEVQGMGVKNKQKKLEFSQVSVCPDWLVVSQPLLLESNAWLSAAKEKKSYT